MLGQGVEGARRVEHGLEVLDEIEAASLVGGASCEVGGGPHGGDRRIGRKHAVGVECEGVVIDDGAVGQRPKGGGDPRPIPPLVVVYGSGHHHETVLHPVVYSQVIGQSENGVDAPVERVLEFGHEPIDSLHLLATAHSQMALSHRFGETPVGFRGERQRMGLARLVALVEDLHRTPQHLG